MAFWDKITSRGNVDDRRGLAPVVGGIGLTGIALMFLINALVGGDPVDVLRQLEDVPVQTNLNNQVAIPEFEGEDSYEVFVSTVLGSNNEYWTSVLGDNGVNYQPPKLVLFRSATESGCGRASSEFGPHYCPLDQTIYIDETFFDEMTSRLGAKGGDVAEAYVISHEIGHHVQNLLGIMQKESELGRGSAQNANDYSIMVELQADCFAGLWASSLKDKDIFLPGEINEAMDAAASVGDDRIQESVTGRVNPENWTHGSSEQRLNWFNKGYTLGEFTSCDTFK